MKRKTILFGVVLAVFLMLTMPCVTAVNAQNKKRSELKSEKTISILTDPLILNGGKNDIKADFFFEWWPPAFGYKFEIWLTHERCEEIERKLEEGQTAQMVADWLFGAFCVLLTGPVGGLLAGALLDLCFYIVDGFYLQLIDFSEENGNCDVYFKMKYYIFPAGKFPLLVLREQ